MELPGLEDPTRVEEVIKSTAKLEIHAVVGGPYEDEAAALQANKGVIPFGSVLMQGVASAEAPVRSYLLKRASEVQGTDFRDAQPSQDMNGRPNIIFTLTSNAGDRFYKYTSEHSSTSATPGTVVLENRVREVMGINSAIRDHGEIEGAFTKQQAADLSLMLGFLKATLTLPGIAGTILTVGMGVDSNVLIFEENPGRVANWQVCSSSGEGRICARMEDNSGYACYDCSFGGNPLSVWHRSHTRIRADPNDGLDSESLHRCFRFQIDLRRHSPEERKSGNALDLAGACGAT